MNHIDIIRVGRAAKNFNAVKAFKKGLKADADEKANLEVSKEELRVGFMKKMEEIKPLAKELPSGLKIHFLKEGEGPKPGIGANIRIHYSVFFDDGKFLDSNRKEIAKAYGSYTEKRNKMKRYNPFPSTYSMDAALIQGFKEGLQQMKFGDRVILFVPWHLAYGEQESRGIPAKSDLIFDLEMYPKEDK